MGLIGFVAMIKRFRCFSPRLRAHKRPTSRDTGSSGRLVRIPAVHGQSGYAASSLKIVV